MRIAQQQQRAERIGIGGVFPVPKETARGFAQPDCRFRPAFLPEKDQVCRIRRVAVMQDHVGIVLMRTLITEIPFQGSTLGAGASPR
ncbi:hypothetical protein BFX40_09825 [Mesorhizobium sp. SEMIA 3007]|nr:hypothetical protein BFX40_09825 [Mesorhizobium sp. SEMIA 3007]